MANSSSKDLRYRFGTFELDPIEGRLAKAGVRVKLQDLPLRLLIMLVERPGEVVTREEVRQRLWPENTFVEFDNSLGVAVRKVRESLGDDADAPRYLETIPRRGYRFIAPVLTDTPVLDPATVPAALPEERLPENSGQQRSSSKWPLAAGIALVAVALLGAGAWLWRDRINARIPERAALVVGEFSNTTGEALFDGSLRRAAVVQLGQSPYLSILPDEKLGQILQSLGRSPDESLSPALAREVCQRAHAAALITGSIQSAGGAYLLSMEANRCSDESSLAHETLSVANQQQVLPKLGEMVDGFRRRLGESRESLQKYNVPVEQATTSSLEALKAYQLGLELRSHAKNVESRPAFKTAIALDPNFAIAYAQLGSAYSNEGDTKEGEKYFRKAFELRARATEPERLYIAGRYFDIVTGELEKGSETYKLWAELYPNEWRPYNSLANDAYMMGRYETVVEAARQAVRLGPNQNFAYNNLLSGLIGLNRVDEARKMCEQLQSQGNDESFIHLILFGIAFLRHDQGGLRREIEWGQKHPDDQNMIYVRAQADAASGKLREGTELLELFAKMNVASGDAESAADALAFAGEINSEDGRAVLAQKEFDAALKLAKSEVPLGLAGLGAARAGDQRRAQDLLDQLNHDYPLSTLTIGVFSPMVRTNIATAHGSSAKEVTSLMEPALPYEFGFQAGMVPIYVRAMSYLDVHAPEAAAREFQKILDHHYVDAVSTLYPLSELGIGRAYAMLGRKAESRKAYEEFFELWKDADKDLPIILKARKEFQALT
jgi:eukaryotic-like serine/threonine-protein kinase